MLAEAPNAKALARGMQGFQISAARHINTALAEAGRRRRGPVFVDRYHLEVISSPTRARHALSYVMNNWRKHREDQQGVASAWLVDPFSTGILFPDWKDRARGHGPSAICGRHPGGAAGLRSSQFVQARAAGGE